MISESAVGQAKRTGFFLTAKSRSILKSSEILTILFDRVTDSTSGKVSIERSANEPGMHINNVYELVSAHQLPNRFDFGTFLAVCLIARARRKEFGTLHNPVRLSTIELGETLKSHASIIAANATTSSDGQEALSVELKMFAEDIENTQYRYDHYEEYEVGDGEEERDAFSLLFASFQGTQFHDSDIWARQSCTRTGYTAI
jgi:hypothetical protein